MNKAVKRIAAGLVFSLVAIGAVGCSTSTSVNVSQNLDGKSIQTVDIISPSTKVHLVATDGDQVQVALTGKFSGDEAEKDQLLSAAVDGSALRVEVQKAGTRMWKVNELQLEVQVPKRIYEGIKLETSGGDITLDAFEAKKLTVNASSGDVKIAGYQGDEFQVETSSGDMDLQKMTGIGTVTASSGDVVIVMDELKQPLSIETSSGEVSLKVPSQASFRLEADTKWEDAKIDVPLTIESQNGDKVSGTVNNAAGDAPLLKVKTSSGHFQLGLAGQ